MRTETEIVIAIQTYEAIGSKGRSLHQNLILDCLKELLERRENGSERGTPNRFPTTEEG